MILDILWLAEMIVCYVYSLVLHNANKIQNPGYMYFGLLFKVNMKS